MMMPFQATVAMSCFGWYPTMHHGAHPHGYGPTSLRRGLSTLITTLFIKLQIYDGDTRSRIASFMMKNLVEFEIFEVLKSTRAA